MATKKHVTRVHPGSRTFGGKQYTFLADSPTKQAAEAQAEGYRNTHFVRIIKKDSLHADKYGIYLGRGKQSYYKARRATLKKELAARRRKR